MPRFRASLLVALILFFFILLVDLPENLHVKFNLGKFRVDQKINPLRVDFNFMGKRIFKDFKTHLGLDLKGGSHLVFEADIKDLKPENREEALSGARNIIERRINFFGVSEPNVQTSKLKDKYRIIVDIPEIKDLNQAVNLIGKTAQLEFTEEAQSQDKIATDTPLFLRITKKTGLTGADVKKSQIEFDGQGKPSVGLEFTAKGAKKFEELTKKNIGKPVGIFIDGFPISIPVVQQVISEGKAQITGSFSLDEARKLSIAINSGALPISIKLVEQRSIGPTLGQSEVRKSLIAGSIGLITVILFMVFYYGKFGIIASFALLIYGLISLAIIRTIPVVLTLPGIAGFILSIGMAVDSNILIFERIKEEMRKGKNLDIAIRLGFSKAIEAIKDANFTTLLVAFILFNPLNWSFFPQFGLVKGFALTLIVGVTTSLFTGVVITKRLINIFYKQK